MLQRVGDSIGVCCLRVRKRPRVYKITGVVSNFKQNAISTLHSILWRVLANELKCEDLCLGIYFGVFVSVLTVITGVGLPELFAIF
jgi:hypothetical protein